MIIALCGKSGSGKSALSAALKDMGVYVIDADKIGKNIMQGDVLKKVELEFPDCFEDGILQRQKLAQKVFSDEKCLNILNSVTHPAIKEKICDEINKNAEKYNNIIVDAAVLIEAGMSDVADFSVAVIAPDELRKRRITERDGISESMADTRISAQKSDEFYIKNTDYHVVNDGTVCIGKLAADILERSKAFGKNKFGI